MLSRMTSAELTEWMAYFKILDEPAKPQAKTADVLKAMFANRIVRKTP
jgi:hypothetical protein